MYDPLTGPLLRRSCIMS